MHSFKIESFFFFRTSIFESFSMIMFSNSDFLRLYSFLKESFFYLSFFIFLSFSSSKFSIYYFSKVYCFKKESAWISFCLITYRIFSFSLSKLFLFLINTLFNSSIFNLYCVIFSSCEILFILIFLFKSTILSFNSKFLSSNSVTKVL